jgi:hypothetical protein
MSQYVALVVRNNILKFHQDRTINDPPISDRNDYVENSISLLLSLFGRTSSLKSWFFSHTISTKLQAFLLHFFFLFLGRRSRIVRDLLLANRNRGCRLYFFWLTQGLAPHVGGTTQQWHSFMWCFKLSSWLDVSVYLWVWMEQNISIQLQFYVMF